jgi:2-succinyl-6-hydroxy-2,4-cyclohexadiene-1-carboxylate synthase
VPHVVFVPGFTQTAASWDGVREVVDESCDTLAVEVPVRETFAATAASIGTRGKEGVYVGYSMGGRLCMRLALDRPDLVRALVVVSASPGISDRVARAERVASDEVWARIVERDGVDRFLEQWLAQPMFQTVPADAPGLTERHALSEGYIAHCLRVLGTGAMESMWARIGELGMPVALVTGTNDEKFDAIAIQMFERIHGNAQHIRLEGGHALPVEAPAVLGGFVAAFAAQHG